MSNNFDLYKNFISLGGNCFVAEDLIHLGLRCCSYPFDWCMSADFSGVIRAIKNGFEDFVSYDCLLQHKSAPSRYFNEKYQLSFFHDFDKYVSLKTQIKPVQEKYSRRCARFLKDICEPTVFFRYVIASKDFKYILQNHKEIDAFLKSFCPQNRIIYIVHSDILKDTGVEYYLVDKDENNWYTKTPIQKSSTLYGLLKDANFPQREENLKVATAATPKKAYTKHSIQRLVRSLIKKHYIHSRITEN